MKTLFYFLLIAFLTLVSCKNKVESTYNLTENKRQWIKPNLWIDELANLHNFPFWFDDSLVATNKIQKITQTEYFTTYSTFNSKQIHNLLPSKKIDYFFDNQGKVTALQIKLFNNGSCYLTQKYTYSSDSISKFMYAKFDLKTIYSDQQRTSNSERQFYLEQKSPNYLNYFDSISKQHLYLITNIALTSPISIDTMIRPAPIDLLVIPNLYRPQKMYKVANKIIESSCYEFQYDSYQNLTKYSYRQKSSQINVALNYAKNGYLNGFEEAFYSGKLLIKKDKQTIRQDQLGRPTVWYQNTTKPKLKKVVMFQYY